MKEGDTKYMCGFVGFVNYQKDLTKEKTQLEKMSQMLSKRGPDENGLYCQPHVGLAHRRLIVIDPVRRKATNDRVFF